MLFQFPPTITYEVTDVFVITNITDVSASDFRFDVPIANPTNVPPPNALAPSRNDLKRRDNNFSLKKSPIEKKTDESAKP